MRKPILTAFLFTSLLIGFPAVTMAAANGMEVVESDFNEIGISIQGQSLHIVNANGMMLQIYNVTGVCVMNAKIDGADKRYDLNLQRGCYIIKVGKVVRKISIR
jgi:hypothetical protein